MALLPFGSAPTPNATTSKLGKIMLAGDLAGTASSPTVSAINGITVTGTPTSGQVLTATSGTAADWATPTSGGSQTPWTSNISGAGYSLSDVSTITTNSTLTAGGANTSNGGVVHKVTSISANYSALTTDSLIVSAAFTTLNLTLPTTGVTSGQIIQIIAGVDASLTIAAASGDVAGQTSILLTAGNTLSVVWNGATWLAVGMTFFPFGTTTHPNAGLGEIGTTSVTSGTAVQPFQLSDSMCYINTTSAGTLSLQIGPTSSPTTYLYDAVAMGIGYPISFRLPASWYVLFTLSTGMTMSSLTFVQT